MKTTRCILFSILFAAVMFSCGSKPSGADDEMARLIDSLDESIANRDIYIARKSRTIDSLKNIYRSALDPAGKFDALGRLYDEYRSYNTDSAIYICHLRQQIAPLTGNPDDIIHADLNMADQLMFTGMYNEALNIIEPVSSTDLPDYLRPYLFHIKRTIYGLLNDCSLRDEDHEKYSRLTLLYRDSLLLANDENSLTYNMVLCDKLNAEGEPEKGIEGLLSYIEENNLDDHDKAIAAFTLANSYHLMGDRDNEKRQLLHSSINDMRSAVKEYLSLRSLALLLYEEGDVKHAYDYLKICMQDAQECNARQRIVEINSIFPVVNSVYLDTIDRQKSRLHVILWIVVVLLMFLLISIYFIRKQVKRVSAAKQNEEAMNAKLKELNAELKDYNDRLLDANKSLAENSYLKEEYIARYMDQCLGYIDKLDSYRKSLYKLAQADRIDEIKKKTKSVTFIDGELRDFYDNFDTTFLRLFPGFVAEFNKLLRPEEQIVPKSTDKLNTELRIFALIRLGVNDSVKIAKFLRYSVTTIYNYRTRVRNKALGDRDKLEEELMKIGRH